MDAKPALVIGLDHICLMFSDLERSVEFYDPVMHALGSLKGDKPIDGAPQLPEPDGRARG